MADPLAQTAADFAPSPAAPTNYLDPTPGRDVISRYGNSRASMETLDRVNRLDASGANTRMTLMRERNMAADQPLVDRERELALSELDMDELDLQDRKAARSARVGLIEGLSQIDPRAPDYFDLRTELLKTMPPGVLQDEVIQDILGSKDEIAKGEERLRQDLELKRAQQDKEIAVLDARLQRDYGLKGVPPELVDKYRLPDGSLDMLGLSYEAGRAAREGKMEDFKAAEDIRQQNRMEILGVRMSEKEREAAADRARKSVEVRPRAFPKQVDVLRRALVAKELGLGSMEELTPEQFNKRVQDHHTSLEALDNAVAAENPVAYAEALAWDKAQTENEIEAARMRTMAEYVDAVPGLSADERKLREDFWRAANDAWDEAPDAGGPAAPAAPETPAAPGAGAGNPLDRDAATRFLLEAGGDKEKARQLAREAGYSF